MKTLLVSVIFSIVAAVPALAAPGFANDVCGASNPEVAFAAAANRAHYLRYIIWPEHAETLERLQGMQARSFKSPRKVSGKMVREALSGVKRAALEAFTGNNDMTVSVYSQNSIPQLELNCANSSKSGFTGFLIPLDDMFLGNQTQQISIITLVQ